MSDNSLTTYLGDGVYAQQDGRGVVLTTGCHFACSEQKPDNVIVLEPEVLDLLEDWLARRKTFNHTQSS